MLAHKAEDEGIIAVEYLAGKGKFFHVQFSRSLDNENFWKFRDSKLQLLVFIPKSFTLVACSSSEI